MTRFANPNPTRGSEVLSRKPPRVRAVVGSVTAAVGAVAAGSRAVGGSSCPEGGLPEEDEEVEAEADGVEGRTKGPRRACWTWASTAVEVMGRSSTTAALSGSSTRPAGKATVTDSLRHNGMGTGP